MTDDSKASGKSGDLPAERAAPSLSSSDLRSMETTQASYERIPYRTQAWPSSQPSHLQTTARLMGLDIAPPEHCRMLELGCGDGGNLIPLAIAHPKSEFVGIDLAKVHIDAGLSLVGQLGLSNVRMEARSFVELPESPGGFDYIVAHGLLSWVTPTLQEHLFAVCKRLLSPNGVAFLSYNTYPGWYMQHSIREQLRKHNRGIEDLEQCIDRARKLLEVLVQTVPEGEAGYRDYLEAVGKIAHDPSKKYYFAHEYLEDENHPFYVLDFIERAAEHGLQYVADADLIDMELDNMPEQPAQLLGQLVESRAQRLQILDYAVNRKFRQSLLCHQDATLNATPDLGTAASMYVSSKLQPEGEVPPVETGDVASFRDKHGRSIEVDQPIVKAALMHFCEVSTHPIAFEELIRRASQRIGDPGAAEDRSKREFLAIILGRLRLADRLELRASAPCWTPEAGERPLASPLVRMDAAARRRTTSLRHRALSLDNEAVCQVLERLDGERDRARLLEDVELDLDEAELEKILTLAGENAVLMQ